MKLDSASSDDALLAVSALHRLAQLLNSDAFTAPFPYSCAGNKVEEDDNKESQKDSNGSKTVETEKKEENKNEKEEKTSSPLPLLSPTQKINFNRQLEQLLECVEPHLHLLALEDLAKYLWSLCTILDDDIITTENIKEEDNFSRYLKLVLQEYMERIRPQVELKLKKKNMNAKSAGSSSSSSGFLIAPTSSLTCIRYPRLLPEQLSLMIWTLGCVKEKFGLANELLLNHLVSLLHSYSSDISPSMNFPSSTLSLLNQNNEGIDNTNSGDIIGLSSSPSLNTISSSSSSSSIEFSSDFLTDLINFSSSISTSFQNLSKPNNKNLAATLGTIKPRLLVRTLWAFSLFYNTNSNNKLIQDIAQSVLELSIPILNQVSIPHKISLIWTISQYNLVHPESLLPLLNNVRNYVKNGSLNYELLAHLSNSLRKISVKYRRYYIKIITIENLINSYIQKNKHLVKINNKNLSKEEEENEIKKFFYQNINNYFIKNNIYIPNKDNIMQNLKNIGEIMLNIIEQTEKSLTKLNHMHEENIKKNKKMISLNESDSILPLYGLVPILRASAAIEMPSSNGLLQKFLDKSLIFVENYLQNIKELKKTKGNFSFSSLDAASLLEAMVTAPDYPYLVSRYFWEKENNITSTSTSKTNCDSKFFSPDESVSLMIQSIPKWHSIAGRLAITCSLTNLPSSSSTSFSPSFSSSLLLPSSLSQLIIISSRLVSASWAVASLGHSYRPLFRKTKKSIQNLMKSSNSNTFLLSQSLAKLSVTIASEDSASYSSGGGLSVKLDHDFVDFIFLKSLSRLQEIESLKDLVSCVVSIAFVGKISSIGSRLLWNNKFDDENSSNSASPGSSSGNTNVSTRKFYYPDFSSIFLNPDSSTSSSSTSSSSSPSTFVPNNAVYLSSDALSYLTTQQLIHLQWAMGRLPSGIFSPLSLVNIKNELKKRRIMPDTKNSNKTNPFTYLDNISTKDAYLYVKTIVDSLPLNNFNSVRDQVCESLVKHCKLSIDDNEKHYRSFSNPPDCTLSPNHSCDYETVSPSAFPRDHTLPYSSSSSSYWAGICCNPNVLIDSLQAFLELNYYNKEFEELIENYLKDLEKSYFTQNDSLPSGVSSTSSLANSTKKFFSSSLFNKKSQFANSNDTIPTTTHSITPVNTNVSPSSLDSSNVIIKNKIYFYYGILSELLYVYKSLNQNQQDTSSSTSKKLFPSNSFIFHSNGPHSQHSSSNEDENEYNINYIKKNKKVNLFSKFFRPYRK